MNKAIGYYKIASLLCSINGLMYRQGLRLTLKRLTQKLGLPGTIHVTGSKQQIAHRTSHHHGQIENTP